MKKISPGFPDQREANRLIQQNLERVKQYVLTLIGDIENPEKQGPGTQREQWRSTADTLLESIIELEQRMDPKGQSQSGRKHG